jgi:glycosyltransferase involved in cell wall biosynthesis
MNAIPSARGENDGSLDCPRVSIVVPVFNGARYLRESLESILAQSYPSAEVLVMDDASTDDTPEIVASYGDRIKYHRQSTNRGIYGNTNDGIALACGEYVAVYHGDDVYDPRIVEREVGFLEAHPQAGAVFCLDIFIDADGHEYGRLQIPPELGGGRPLDWPTVVNGLLTYKNAFLTCPSSMVRASVYREMNGYRDEVFRNTSDLDMWVRIARKYQIGVLEEHLFRYRHGHGCSSARYHHLRTTPERYFTIMDLHLSEGGREVATPVALAAYEAHRTQDTIMRSVSHYVLGQTSEARYLLREARSGRLVASRHIQRWRMLALLWALRALVCLPRISFVSDYFYRRWHEKRLPRCDQPSTGLTALETR